MVFKIIEEQDWKIVHQVNMQMAFKADVIILYLKNETMQDTSSCCHFTILDVIPQTRWRVCFPEAVRYKTAGRTLKVPSIQNFMPEYISKNHYGFKIID
jgi:hypothetical protein